MRRWLLVLLACQTGDGGTDTDDGNDDDSPDDTDSDADTDPTPPGETDTAWVIDTGETGVAPECPGVAGAKLCGPPIFVSVPGGGGDDSGDSGDSGGSGAGGGGSISCISIAIEFNPNGVAKIDEADEACVPSTMAVDWECTAPNLIELDGLTTAVWTPAAGMTGATLTSAIWPPLSEDACD